MPESIPDAHNPPIRFAVTSVAATAATAAVRDLPHEPQADEGPPPTYAACIYSSRCAPPSTYAAYIYIYIYIYKAVSDEGPPPTYAASLTIASHNLILSNTSPNEPTVNLISNLN
jgi:hypothetical protein